VSEVDFNELTAVAAPVIVVTPEITIAPAMFIVPALVMYALSTPPT
jgi:hypothetical protein